MSYKSLTPNVVTTAVSKRDLDMSTARTVMMTCFALPDELIFVDCGAILEDALRFRHDMEDLYQRKTTHLLLTHTHWDHCFAMKAFEDVTIVASLKGVQAIKKCIETQKGTGRKVPKNKIFNDSELREAYESSILLIPDIGVKKTATIGPTGQEILFSHTGGHSADSAFIYSPSEKILCTGDNLLTCYAQSVGSGKKMMESYQYWETLDILHVIPGHGDIVGKEYITKVRMYFEELINVLRELKAQGLHIEEVLTHEKLPSYFGKSQKEWIEGSRYHTEWLNFGIKYWYRNI